MRLYTLIQLSVVASFILCSFLITTNGHLGCLTWLRYLERALMESLLYGATLLALMFCKPCVRLLLGEKFKLSAIRYKWILSETQILVCSHEVNKGYSIKQLKIISSVENGSYVYNSHLAVHLRIVVLRISVRMCHPSILWSLFVLFSLSLWIPFITGTEKVLLINIINPW